MADAQLNDEIANPAQTTAAMPHRISINTVRQPSSLLMTHTTGHTELSPTPSVSIGGLNFSGRTAEQSRIFADNISTAFQEIRPLLEQARAPHGIVLTSWLNGQTQQETPPSAADSYVINLNDQPSTSNIGSSHHQSTHDHHHHHHRTATDNFLNNIREAANAESQNNNNNAEEGATDARHISPETRALLEILQQYVPFVLILLAKCIYDHRAGILHFLALLVTFIHTNNNLKLEIAKQENRSRMVLLVVLFYILGCIVFIDYMSEEHKLYLSLVLIPSYTQPITLWELLWSLAITDYILKLITIVFKAILTCLPVRILAFQKRGKYYLMIEATSQLYRSIATIQPWLYYLLEAYQGPEKVLGVFLSAAYMVSKGSDLVSRGKLFRTAAWKLLQNVNIGVSPSKEQLTAAGGICAICHEEYATPVRLRCKHIFCETCVSTWLDRESTCPLCRAPITDDPVYRDGHTTSFIQLY
ncbi:ring finger protein, transmembrane 2 isoform X1 [Neodiprion pinetum]|uniref:RING finger and transmembrane domain-containing protein 2 n=1 Tax=Neodiprion lecontei TaxID=441921 RepID=A0A6J0BEY0_NEOLC|nr:RING finger and transmembrane domain-containing protein 2 isoform X1 [Neodiprion lecontei]XP_015513386.1 RING finger and transmembrane domain-containing protein 2 isoform X1 [Neodiprion lecontei]XP_046473082.1 RING finger and transmembrane domain-containing protein 2 isoform X1 [Neodiprion pinetum]XP_046473083.1 RING finger and transmembrane domain-containing protein 2 isoform X1 [Neodiprion pinetum]